MTILHIGCGAGFAGDRFDAAVPMVADLATRSGPRYLMFEVLAERTLALAQRQRRDNPDAGCSPYVDHYVRPVLAEATHNGIRIVSNMGAANPAAAARRIHAIARDLGIAPLRIAVVAGDDLTETMSASDILAMETMEGTRFDGRSIVAANVYLGARPVAAALATGADIVLVGRTTDSALALGPLIHEFGWAEDDWDRLAAGTVCGHLLECGAQVTGAYFADPGFRDVPDLAHVGFPIAEVGSSGDLVISKPAGTGGLVSRATVTEQLLYEMHDPAAYLVPDVTVDVTDVEVEEIGPDRVRVAGVRGHPAPATLKATVCVDGGWLGEAEMSYAGPNALARAELALGIVRDRLGETGTNMPLRFEILGAGALHDGGSAARRAARALPEDGEYRIRVAGLAPDRDGAQVIADEVQSLYCSGPAAGGGYRCHVTPQIATASVLVPRRPIEARVRIEEVAP